MNAMDTRIIDQRTPKQREKDMRLEVANMYGSIAQVTRAERRRVRRELDRGQVA